MSRTSLIRPRRPRAVCHRPATDTRLLPSPFPPTILHINTHYKRCPKALRLRLRSDQSPSRSLYGRSPDKSRHALSQGPCQVRAPLTRRIRFAASGDAPEHGVMSLPWAIAPPWASAPFPDSPGADLAGQSEQSDHVRLKTNAPFKDSTVVTTGVFPTTNAGHGSPLLSLRMVEHFWWSRPPHTENLSGLLHIPSEVRGKDSTVVTIGELRSTNGGHGSPLPSLGMVEHFWWTRLPRTENFSGLVHIPSEVRGCRRAVTDVNPPLRRTPPIGTGVDAFLRNRPGPSIALPSPTHKSAYPSPTIGGHPCLEEAAGPAPAHPKETTTLSSTVRTPAACGSSPPSLPSYPTSAVLPRVTPRRPGSHQPSHSPPLWTAFPSTLCNSPTPPCKTSIAPSKPFNPPSLSGQGNSPLLAQTKPKAPQNLRGFSRNNQNSRLSPHINQKPPPPGPPCPLIPPSPIMALKPPP